MDACACWGHAGRGLGGVRRVASPGRLARKKVRAERKLCGSSYAVPVLLSPVHGRRGSPGGVAVGSDSRRHRHVEGRTSRLGERDD